MVGTRRRGVREAFDRIASHFAATRPEPWEEVAEFLAGRSGRVGLDVGTGNARHAELLARCAEVVVGVDVSLGSLGTARVRAAERGFAVGLVQGDAAGLPVRSGVVDLAVYVATLHHLPSRALRLGSLDELARVLRPGGMGIVSAWSTTHEAFDRTVGFDTMVDWTLPDGTVVPRYYHIYDPVEFEADVRESRLGVERVFVAKGNCYAVVTG